MRSARAASSSTAAAAAAAAAASDILSPSPSLASVLGPRPRSPRGPRPPGSKQPSRRNCRSRARSTWLRIARIQRKGRHDPWIMDAIRGLYCLFTVSKVQSDGIVARLHVLTALLLLTFAAMVSMKQSVGNPIDCVHTRDIPVEAFNTYCWIHSTYFVTGAMLGVAGVNVAFPGVGSTILFQHRQRLAPQHPNLEPITRQIKYYQWVPFFLMFQRLANAHDKMRLPPGLLLIVCLIASSREEQQQQQNMHKTPKHLRKELDNKSFLSLSSYGGEHPGLVYAKSGFDNVTFHPGENVLVFTIERFADEMSFRKTCWTNLTAEGKEILGVYYLDPDNVVATWTLRADRSLLYVYLTNVEECEWKNVSRLTMDPPQADKSDRKPYVITYANGFDVIFSNLDMCKKRLCKVSYDKKGDIIDELVPIQDDTYDPSLTKPGYSHFPHLAAVSSNSSARGYWVFVEEDEMLNIKILNFRGQVINSKTAHIDPKVNDNNETFVSSNEFEVFGYCWLIPRNKSVSCYQYDTNLRLIFNYTWTIGFYTKQAWLYNLKTGGFLLLAKDQMNGKHYMTLVEGAGRRSDSLEMPFSCDPDYIYTPANDGYYCSFGFCRSKNNARVTTDMHCIPSLVFRQSLQEKAMLRQKQDSTKSAS